MRRHGNKSSARKLWLKLEETTRAEEFHHSNLICIKSTIECMLNPPLGIAKILHNYITFRRYLRRVLVIVLWPAHVSIACFFRLSLFAVLCNFGWIFCKPINYIGLVWHLHANESQKCWQTKLKRDNDYRKSGIFHNFRHVWPEPLVAFEASFCCCRMLLVACRYLVRFGLFYGVRFTKCYEVLYPFTYLLQILSPISDTERQQ